MCGFTKLCLGDRQDFGLLFAMDLLEPGDDGAAGTALFWEQNYLCCVLLFHTPRPSPVNHRHANCKVCISGGRRR